MTVSNLFLYIYVYLDLNFFGLFDVSLVRLMRGL